MPLSQPRASVRGAVRRRARYAAGGGGGGFGGFGGNMGQSIPGYGRLGGGCDPTPNVTSPSLRSRCATVAVGTRVSSRAPRTEPYVRLSRIRLPPRVCDGESGRIRSSAFVTRAWLWVQYVLCWCVFPLAPALRSTDSAALAPADASAVGFLRFVRRLHCYYDEVRLLVSVHHRLRLLAFPMRTAVHTRHATTAARHEISQVPVRSLCT